MRPFFVLSPDEDRIVEEVTKPTARRLVSEGKAVWTQGRAVRLLRTTQKLRDESAAMSERTIEANAASAPWAQALTEGWRSHKPGAG